MMEQRTTKPIAVVGLLLLAGAGFFFALREEPEAARDAIDVDPVKRAEGGPEMPPPPEGRPKLGRQERAIPAPDASFTDDGTQRNPTAMVMGPGSGSIGPLAPRYDAPPSPVTPPRGGAPISGAAQSQQAHLEGLIRFQKGDYEGARARWKEALRLDPDNGDARSALEKLDKLYGEKK